MRGSFYLLSFQSCRGQILILSGRHRKTTGATVNSVSQTLLNNHSLNIHSQFTSIIIAQVMAHCLFLTCLSTSVSHILSSPNEKNFQKIKLYHLYCAIILFQNLSVTTHFSQNNIQTLYPGLLVLSKFASLALCFYFFHSINIY